MSEYKLFEKIVALSEGEDWDTAKKEWKVAFVYCSVDEQCLCGKQPISDISEIINTHNGHTAIVGNCCVKKFFGDDVPEKIAAAIRKLKSKGIDKSIGPIALGYIYDKGAINMACFDFYTKTIRKRILSPKQEKWRVDINEKFLEFTKKH